MHQFLFRTGLAASALLLVDPPMIRAEAQPAEVPPEEMEAPASDETFDFPVPDGASPTADADVESRAEDNSEPMLPESAPAVAGEFSWQPAGERRIVFSGLKEVVAPSMALLENAHPLTDPKNCGIGRSPCLLVFGDLDSEFYAIKQRTFARHAQGPLPGTDFGDRGVNNMLAANFLGERVLDLPYVIQLGETDVDYWIIPKCDAYVRFKKRIPVRQYPNQARSIQLKC